MLVHVFQPFISFRPELCCIFHLKERLDKIRLLRQKYHGIISLSEAVQLLCEVTGEFCQGVHSIVIRVSRHLHLYIRGWKSEDL